MSALSLSHSLSLLATTLRGEEFGKAIRCFAFLFFLMAAYYIVKPVRDALALEFDTGNLPYFYLLVTFAVFGANVLYDRIARSLPRKRFFVIAHLIYAGVFILFAILLSVTTPPTPGTTIPGDGTATMHPLAATLAAQGIDLGETAAAILAVRIAPPVDLTVGSARGTAVILFFLWVSVYILFAATMFWSFVNDIHGPDEGKRLFGYIGAAGPAGALAGSFATGSLVDSLGIPGLLVAASFAIGLSFIAMRATERFAERPPDGDAAAARLRVPAEGLGSVHGFALVFRNRYLLLLAAAMLLYTFNSTFFSVRYSELVRESLPDTRERTRLFATNNEAINLFGILIQLFLTRFILTRLGVLTGLLILPLCDAVGFFVYYGGAGLSAATSVWVTSHALSYSINRAAKEVLYTPAPRSFKYLGKAVVETLFFRIGDALAALYFIVEAQAGLPGILVFVASGVALAGRFVVAAILSRRLREGRIVDRAD